jgi:predicted phage tail protein
MNRSFPSRPARFGSRIAPRRGRSGGRGRHPQRGRRPATSPVGFQHLEPRHALSIAPTSVDSFSKAVDEVAVASQAPLALAANAATVTVPGAPTNVVGTPGVNQVVVTWKAPASNGGAPITNYFVEYSSSNGRTWTRVSAAVSTATTRTVTRLTNGVPFVFRVIAQNSKGQSVASVPSPAATPRSLPAAPTGLQATAEIRGAALRWTAPTGNTLVSDYRVEMSTDKGKTWQVFNDGVSTATTARVTNLNPASGYLFRVSAVNTSGAGAAVATTTEVRPNAATVPGSTTTPLATQGRLQVFLKWGAPEVTGGSPVTDYRIEFSTDSGKTWRTVNDGVSTATSTTVTGLTAGVSHIFRVSAVNAIGVGFPKQAFPVTPLGLQVPLGQIAPTATAGNGKVTLVWAPPADNGGSPVTDYRIEYKTTAATTWTTFNDGTSPLTGAQVTGLTNGTAYVFRVRPVNAVGVGPESSPSAAATPVASTPGTLGAPTNVRAAVAPSPGTIRVTWDAPTGAGAGQITNYRVEYALDSRTPSWRPVTTSSNATSFNVTGLTNGEWYIFRVSAVSPAGLGAASAVSARVRPVGPLF